MVRILAFLIVVVCFWVFMKTYGIWWMRSVRRRGGLGLPGRPTLFDVRDLLCRGEKEKAVEVYGAIFKTSREEAEQAVDELAKEIQS